MGVDLKLLFVDINTDTQEGYSFSQIECNRDYNLHKRIKEQKPIELPIILQGFCSTIPDGSMEGERCYGKIHEDCYGDKITYLSTYRLKLAFLAARDDGLENSENKLSRWNEAIIKFLSSINEETQVALFWH